MKRLITLIVSLAAFSSFTYCVFLVTHNFSRQQDYAPATPIEDIPYDEMNSVQAKARGGDQEAAARLFDYYAFGEGAGKQDSDKQADFWQFQLAENGRAKHKIFLSTNITGCALSIVSRPEGNWVLL